MEKLNASQKGNGLALFACDSCRHKKIKCSRELPKCRMCKPWPGRCIYSKSKANPKPKSSISRDEGMKSAASKCLDLALIEKDLERVESMVRQLSASISRFRHHLTGTYWDSTGSGAGLVLTHDKNNDATQRDKSGIIEPSRSFSSWEDVSSNLEALSAPLSPSFELDSAQRGLKDLSSSLTTSRLVGSGSELPGRFWIPPRQVGYALISQYLQIAELAEPLFTLPTDDVLRRVVFEPASVEQKAWVVCFNHTLASLSSTIKDSEHADQIAMLKKNTHLALNDASLFLEPSETNVQALMLLGLHGEDFASPNLSWMLVGHACRQVQALGLHLVKKNSINDVESQEQKLCLFWGLFTADKSCSLAFGRPCFLPSSAYEHVPQPQFQFLCKFRPHDKKGTSIFGAHHFLKSVELAKITGQILEFLNSGELVSGRDGLKNVLDTWWFQTEKILLEIIDTEKESANKSQAEEMLLGIHSLKFQYLHTLILLLRGARCYAELQLASAREAISLLPAMVSNSQSVYNGVVWQLLYYPFTPFFVIFGEIIYGKVASTKNADMELLSLTGTYFTRMRAQVGSLANVVKRLEHVAEAFQKLASRHMENCYAFNAFEKCDSHDIESRSQAKSSQLSAHIITSPSTRLDRECHSMAVNMPIHSPTDSNCFGSFSPPRPGLTDGNAVQGDFDAPYINEFINWLPMDISTSQPTNLHHTGNETASHCEETSATENGLCDSTFDWLSWDRYWHDSEVLT